ncbi:MAG: hypothetical protein QXK88_09920 [Desulfurococcaceae archaeon]
MDDRLPYSNLVQMFFNETELVNLRVPNTPLAGGNLDPGEVTPFEPIFPYLILAEPTSRWAF